jgi:Trp operon repressor
MEHLGSGMEQQDQEHQIEWRRDKVQELCSKGYSQREISQVLQVGLATVNRDISHLRDEARQSVFIFRKIQIHNPCVYKMK